MRPVPNTTAKPAPSMAEQLNAACDLHDFAVQQIEARIRRERPACTDDDVKRAIDEWLAGGDPGPGRVVPWPR